MKYRPRIIDYVFLGLAALCFLFTLIFVIVKYPSLPDMLPTHFNGRGEIDAWGGKASAVVFPPVIGFIVLITLGTITFFPQLWNNTRGVPASKLPRVIRSTRTGMCMLLFFTEAFFAYAAVCITRISPMHPAFNYGFRGLLGAVILFILVQSFRK